MLAQKEFLNELKQHFRLNIYEVKIWTALLSRGIAAAGELADISGVPRSRCYDVLESLEKKGFIIMKVGKPIKYIAIQPEAILERVKKELKEESERQIGIMESVKDTDIFEELELLHKTGVKHVDVGELSNSILGKDNINRQIRSMVDRAKKSVTIATTAEGFKRKAKLLKNYIPVLRRKGVRVKIIAPIDNQAAKRLQGAELKDMAVENVRFVNVDDEEIMFMLGEENKPEQDTGIWVKSEFFVKAYNELFEESLK